VTIAYGNGELALFEGHLEEPVLDTVPMAPVDGGRGVGP
jgi:hypothetical protein